LPKENPAVDPIVAVIELLLENPLVDVEDGNPSLPEDRFDVGRPSISDKEVMDVVGIFRESRRWEIVPPRVDELISWPKTDRDPPEVCLECLFETIGWPLASSIGAELGSGGRDFSSIDVPLPREWGEPGTMPCSGTAFRGVRASTSISSSSAPSAAVRFASSSSPTGLDLSDLILAWPLALTGESLFDTDKDGEVGVGVDVNRGGEIGWPRPILCNDSLRAGRSVVTGAGRDTGLGSTLSNACCREISAEGVTTSNSSSWGATLDEPAMCIAVGETGKSFSWSIAVRNVRIGVAGPPGPDIAEPVGNADLTGEVKPEPGSPFSMKSPIPCAAPVLVLSIDWRGVRSRSRSPVVGLSVG
jgi:hypothetical protein